MDPSPDYLTWKGQRLYNTAKPGHSKIFRTNELILKSDFDSKPQSKITKAIAKAMNKIGIRDSPSAEGRGIGPARIAPARPPQQPKLPADPASFDVIYPFSVGK